MCTSTTASTRPTRALPPRDRRDHAPGRGVVESWPRRRDGARRPRPGEPGAACHHRGVPAARSRALRSTAIHLGPLDFASTACATWSRCWRRCHHLPPLGGGRRVARARGGRRAVGLSRRADRRAPVLRGHELERGPGALVGPAGDLEGRPGNLGRDRAGHLVGIWRVHRAGADLAPFLDAAAPALLVAQAIGRVGNYFNQELFGRPTFAAVGPSRSIPRTGPPPTRTTRPSTPPSSTS